MNLREDPHGSTDSEGLRSPVSRSGAYTQLSFMVNPRLPEQSCSDAGSTSRLAPPRIERLMVKTALTRWAITSLHRDRRSSRCRSAAFSVQRDRIVLSVPLSKMVTQGAGAAPGLAGRRVHDRVGASLDPR